MLYTVGEMAKLLGVPASTLRYYDQEGLLPFVERANNGTRLFKDSDYEWLQIIECLKKTGMPLKDIKVFIHMAMDGDSTIDPRLELIRRQRESVLKQMEELQQTLDTLDYKVWYYETAKNAGSTSALKGIATEDLPEKFQEVRKRLRHESLR